jgi:transcriptional regulator with XRE-family HTH domain
MVLDTIAKLISDKEPNPNKFTITMGELIRKAREEANLSQDELAKLIYRRRATVSDMETGKVEISAGTILLLAAALEKPIAYFFPRIASHQLPEQGENPLEQEVLIHFRKIWSDHLRELAIDLVKVMADFDPTDLIADNIDTVSMIDERDQELRASLERRRKRK